MKIFHYLNLDSNTSLCVNASINAPAPNPIIKYGMNSPVRSPTPNPIIMDATIGKKQILCFFINITPLYS